MFYLAKQRSRVQPPQEALMGHNIVRLLAVCPGLKPNELFPFSTARC